MAARTPSKPCVNHPVAAASWYCAECKAFLCDGCVVEKISEQGFQNFCERCGGLCIPPGSVLPRRRIRERQPARPRGIPSLAVSLIFNPVSTASSLGEEMASGSKLLQLSILTFAVIMVNKWRDLSGQDHSTFFGSGGLLAQSALRFAMMIFFLAVFCLAVELVNKMIKFSDPRWIYLFSGSYFIFWVNMVVGIIIMNFLQNNEIAQRAASYLIGLWGTVLCALLMRELYECGLVTAIVVAYFAMAVAVLPGLVFFFVRVFR